MSESEHEELRASSPNSGGPQGAAGEMGVSSERVGPAGPGQEATDGLRDVSPHESDPDDETLPEQSTGTPEENPSGIAPKAGYPSADPGSKD